MQQSASVAALLLLVAAGACRHPAALNWQAERVRPSPALSSACNRAWRGPSTGALLLRLKGGGSAEEEQGAIAGSDSIETEDDDAFLFQSGDEGQQELPKSLKRAVDEVRTTRRAHSVLLLSFSALIAAPARMSDA